MEKEITWDGTEQTYNEICREIGRRTPLTGDELNLYASGKYVSVKIGQTLIFVNGKITIKEDTK